MRRLSIITFFFGLWLIGAPFIYGYGGLSTAKMWGPSMSEQVVLGILIAGFSVLTFLNGAAPRGMGIFMLIFGVWVMLDPMLYSAWHFTKVESMNDLGAGVAIMILALFQLFAMNRNPA